MMLGDVLISSIKKTPRPIKHTSTNSFSQSLFKYMGQSRPLFCFFVLFTLQFKIKLKNVKVTCYAWNLNPEAQDGRRRRIHRAIAATSSGLCTWIKIFIFDPSLIRCSASRHRLRGAPYCGPLRFKSWARQQCFLLKLSCFA